MTTSTIGLLAGLLLGIAAATDGFVGFLIALVLGVVGYLIGGHYDGEVDLSRCSAAGVVSEPAQVDPGDRGRLEVAGQVVERIATIAATQVPGVVSTGSALEGVLGRRYPKAAADVAGDHTSVSLDLAVAWATPLADAAATVRDKVRAQLHDLAGLNVDAVDVTVAKVVAQPSTPVRRVQ